jgi:hypothetical protein
MLSSPTLAIAVMAFGDDCSTAAFFPGDQIADRPERPKHAMLLIYRIDGSASRANSLHSVSLRASFAFQVFSSQ